MPWDVYKLPPVGTADTVWELRLTILRVQGNTGEFTQGPRSRRAAGLARRGEAVNVTIASPRLSTSRQRSTGAACDRSTTLVDDAPGADSLTAPLPGVGTPESHRGFPGFGMARRRRPQSLGPLPGNQPPCRATGQRTPSAAGPTASTDQLSTTPAGEAGFKEENR